MTRPKKTALCPLGGVGVSGKLMFWTWYHLLSGTKRFGELQRLIPDASRQMLTLQLRQLERAGVLHRRVYSQNLPKVEYSLTELAQLSEPMLRDFHAWGTWFCNQSNMEFDDMLVSLGGKWKIWIWYHLLSGAKRFSELQRLLPQASRQVLTTQLRELERMGVLHRLPSMQGPLKVEYALTPLGQQSESLLHQIYEWGRWFCDQSGIEFDWPVRDDAQTWAHLARLA